MEENTQKSSILADRIKQIRTHFCSNSNTYFAQKINRSAHFASQLCTGKSNPGSKMLDTILQAFPEVSRTWLYFGEGEMLKAEVVNTANGNTNSSIVQGKTVTTAPEGLETLISTNAKQADTIARQSAQIDRLLAILEQKLMS